MILLTGANGLVGSFIGRKLLENNIPFKALVREGSDLSTLNDVKQRIEFIQGDVLDIPNLSEALNKVETVIHCAAVVSFNPRDKKMLQKINIEGTRNLLNLSLEKKIEHFIHISSVGALGKSRTNETINEMMIVTGITRINSPRIPVMKSSGTNTRIVVVVPEALAEPMPLMASPIISLRFAPLRFLASIASLIIVASSTNRPSASTSANSVMVFSVLPVR